jgi:hypothetical protein
LWVGYSGKLIYYVNGIRVVDGVANDAVAGSGKPPKQLPGLELPYPALPALSGAYRSAAEHPRVFTTAAELRDLASRINQAGSYSMQRFGQLAGQIARDLAAHIDWDAAYSGCNEKTYLFAFSYEPQEAGFLDTLRADLKPAPGTAPPAGAAVVASRLALYSALVKAGAALPPGAPNADQATALAKRIMLAWANHGFPQDPQGHFLPLRSFFCDDAGKPSLKSDAGAALALGLGRGVVYSVQAQDLLQFVGAVSTQEERQLNAFHGALFDLIRQAHNKVIGNPRPECERYANGESNALASMLAIARLLDDDRRFTAVLNGADRSIPVVLPWIRFFDHAIYGEADSPLDCYPNAGADSLTSLGHGAYATASVAAGEVQDRYRNGHQGQGIGYPMFNLERLINATEIMRDAGFDAYGYRGRHRQSIEMAIGYYACLAKAAGFGKVVTAAIGDACPNAAQYYGKVVNDVDRMALVGAARFPRNPAIAAVEVDARASAASTVSTFSTDALLFGKWRDQKTLP